VCYRDTSSEFAVCADGWYWQWRRVRVEEYTGTAMGPLNGPFVSEAEARAHEADPNNKTRGMSRVFDADGDRLSQFWQWACQVKFHLLLSFPRFSAENLHSFPNLRPARTSRTVSTTPELLCARAVSNVCWSS
jgi:hypothetical protein